MTKRSFLEFSNLQKEMLIYESEHANSMEDSPFLETVGTSPIARVLDFLITHHEFDYSITEIAEKSQVGWSTMHTFWKKLKKSRIVKNTRIVGNSKMYKLNLTNPIAKQLVEFSFNLSKIYGEREIVEQKIKIET